MPAELDPLSQVYNRLWDMVGKSPRVTSLVRVGNMIRYNDPSYSSPAKDEISNADLPEMILVVTQLTGSLRSNSSSSSLVMRLEWWLSTGDVNVTRGILPLLWALYATLCDWVNLNNDLTWNNKTFLKLLNLTDATAGLTDAEKNRGIRGFSSIWATEVTLYFTTTDVIASAGEI